MDRIYTFSDLENINKFVSSLKRKAKKYNIKLELNDDKFVTISDEIKCSGYFEEKFKHTPGLLTTATGKPINMWLPVLVHESCHMDQWEEKSPIWKEYQSSDTGIIDLWLAGKRVNSEKVYKALDISRDMELDCEQRAVNKIIKFDLPIDITEYIQKANCYIFFYNYLKISKKWSLPGNSPYNNPNIYKKVSGDWYDDYSITPKEIDRLFKKYKIGYDKI